MFQGDALDSFTDDLIPVPEQHNKKPLDSFDFLSEIGDRSRRYAKARFGHGYSRDVDYLTRALPFKALQRLSFDQICKMRASSVIMLDSTVEEKFNEPRFRIVEKLRSSM